MSCFSVRPQSLTLGLPGMGRTKAYNDKQSKTRQTLHKLATLDPLAAQKELHSDSKYSAKKAKILIERANGVKANVPATSRTSIAKAISCLGRKVATVVGLKHRKPQSHTELLRYANTQPGSSGPSLKDKAVSQTPAALHDVIPALVHKLECEDAHLHARIDTNHASGVDAVLTQEIDQILEKDDSLAWRRALNLANQAYDLRRLHDELTAWLRWKREAAATATKTLNKTQAKLSEATQALGRALPKEIDQQSTEVLRLEQALQNARLTACEAAKMLYLGRSSPILNKLERKVTDTNAKIKTLQSELAIARAELLALQQLRRQLGQDAQPSSGFSPAPPAHSSQPADQTPDADAHEVSLLAQRVTRLKRDNDDQLAALQAHQAHVHKSEQRLRDVEAKLKQTRHSWEVTMAQLDELYDKAADLKALQSQLESVVLEHKADAEKAKTKAQEAHTKLNEKLQALLSKLLGDMPGFRTEEATGQAPQALRDWADELEQAVSFFKADALPASSVLTLGMQALSMATGENPAKAEETLRELRALSLHDLIPPPGDPVDVSASMAALSEAGRTTLCLLASEPRGMQVIAHLLAPQKPAPTKEKLCEQLYAARIYLQADDALRRSPPADKSARQYLENAKRAVQHALHAPSVSEGLAAKTVDDNERAAYHGFRNGYQSNSSGSAYQKTNQHLQMLADWIHDAAPYRSSWKSHTPFHALHEALKLAAATVLPTPERHAREEFAKAADHLLAYMVARRQQLPPGQVPSEAELAMQALAEYVQRTPIETDLLTLKLDKTALRSIKQRQHELLQRFEQQANQSGAASAQAPPHPGLDATWQALQVKVHTLPEAMSLLQRQLAKQQAPMPSQPEKEAAYWAVQETCILDAVEKASHLLRDGDPDRVTSAQAFHDLFAGMLGHMEWRDKLRFVEQKVSGVNLAPLNAAKEFLGLPFGFKLILSFQLNEEMVVEFYMGRTGPYIQIGKQKTNQFQVGGGLSCGYLWCFGEEFRIGVGGSGDLRFKTESSIEQGVQLRVPRRTRGKDVEIMAQFLDVFKHLLDLAEPQPGGSPAPEDWMRELLAHHPNLNVGLIDNAPRKTTGTESNISGGAVLRIAGCLNIGPTFGVKSKQDKSRTSTTVAGNMTTIYKDSTAQTKSEFHVKLGASLRAFSDEHKAGGQGGFFDLGYGREIRAKGRTHFCTVFTFDGEIDPARTDRAIDFQSFKEFEREVRNDWDAWVHYGTPKLASRIDESMHYVVAEKQLEYFLEQTRAFTKHNKLATMYADYTLKAEAAPLLDALRAEANLWRKAGREDLAQRAERNFDDLMTEPALWEPAILVLREKTKLQVERGIDFFFKTQKNRLAESQRTVGQWVQYEPVERPEPGQKIEYVRTWTPKAPGDFSPIDYEASEKAGKSGLNDNGKETFASPVHKGGATFGDVSHRENMNQHLFMMRETGDEIKPKLKSSKTPESITPRSLLIWREQNQALKDARKATATKGDLAPIDNAATDFAKVSADMEQKWRLESPGHHFYGNDDQEDTSRMSSDTEPDWETPRASSSEDTSRMSSGTKKTMNQAVGSNSEAMQILAAAGEVATDKWFRERHHEVVHNDGNANNCLLLALLQHATGRYEHAALGGLADKAHEIRRQLEQMYPENHPEHPERHAQIKPDTMLEALPGTWQDDWLLSDLTRLIEESLKDTPEAASLKPVVIAPSEHGPSFDGLDAIPENDMNDYLGQGHVIVYGRNGAPHFEAVKKNV